MPKVKSYVAKHGQTPPPKKVMRRATRNDNWENAFTGLNIRYKDKRIGAVPKAYLLSEVDAEAIYTSDPLAAKIVDTLPNDMLREGFKLSSPDWNDEKISEIMKYLEETMKWREHFSKALIWARLYGGSALLLGLDDTSENAREPLKPDRIQDFSFVTVLNRWELEQVAIQSDPTRPGYGLPSLYRFQPRTTQPTDDGMITYIHASRLLRFDGATLPRKEFIGNHYWSDSVLSKLWGPIRNYATTHDSVASLMQDFAQAVFKIKNLADLISSKDGKQLLYDRIDMVELSRSVINATIIADDEEFERKTTPLSGVEEIIRKMEERLVAASSYPHTVLLGEAPGGGIGDKGNSEHRDYYDFVARKQEQDLKDALRTFILYCLKSKTGPTQGKVPKNWTLEFNPLWQDSQTEIMEQRKKQAEIDQIYIQNQVLSPDEVAESRFSTGQYSHDTKLFFERDPESPPPEPEEIEQEESQTGKKAKTA